MKKEKIIKTHTRKTKSGKTVTVKQHTAKYDAADEAKKLAKKIGAGKELEKKKKWVMDETERDIMDRFNSMEESEHPQTKHFLPPGKDHNTIRMKTIQALVSKHGKKASNMNDIRYISEYKRQKEAVEKTPKYTATSDLYDKKTHGEFLKKLRKKYNISKVFTDNRKKWRTVTIYGGKCGKEEEVKKAISRQYPGAKIQKIDKPDYLSGFRVYLPHKKDN